MHGTMNVKPVIFFLSIKLTEVIILMHWSHMEKWFSDEVCDLQKMDWQEEMTAYVTIVINKLTI
jgi:hypothetical protein